MVGRKSSRKTIRKTAAHLAVQAWFEAFHFISADRHTKNTLRKIQMEQRSFLAQEMEVQLRRLGPHNHTAVLPLTNGDSTWIAGRGSNSDILILSRFASRTHFSIKYRNNNFYIFDHESANGTYINDRRIHSKQDYPLPLNAIISVGVTSLHQNEPDCIVFAFEPCRGKQLVKVERNVEEGYGDTTKDVEEVDMSPTNHSFVPPQSIPSESRMDGKRKEAKQQAIVAKRFCQLPTSTECLKVERGEETISNGLTETREKASEKEDNCLRMVKSEPECVNQLVTKTEMIAMKEEMYDLNGYLPVNNTEASSAEIDLFEPEGYADDEIIHAFEAQTQPDEPVIKQSQLSYSMTEDYIEISDSEDELSSNIKTEMGNVSFIKSELEEDDYDDDVICLDIIKTDNTDNYQPMEIKIEDDDEFTETDMKWMGKLFKTKEECCSFIQTQRENVESGDSGEGESGCADLVSNCAREFEQVLHMEGQDDKDKLLGTEENSPNSTTANKIDSIPLHLLDNDNSVVVGLLTLSQVSESRAEPVESDASNNKKKRSPSPGPSGEDKTREKPKRIKLYDPYEFEDDSNILKPIPKKRLSDASSSGCSKTIQLTEIPPKIRKSVLIPAITSPKPKPKTSKRRGRKLKVDSLPASEKNRIKDQRRKKLRELCSRAPPKAGKSPDEPKSIAPLKVKITRKNRNEYLCEQIRNERNAQLSGEKTPEKPTETRDANSAVAEKKGESIPKEPAEERSPATRHDTCPRVDQIINDEKDGYEVSEKSVFSDKLTSNQLQNVNVIGMKSDGRDLKSCLKKSGYAFMRSNRPIAPLKSVRFDTSRNIKYYETENKITKKTSSLNPYKGRKLTSDQKLLRQKNAVISEICRWNVAWLEECKKAAPDELPPVFNNEKMKSVHKSFPNHDYYMKTFVPLLLLELWFSVTERWKMDSSGLYRFPAVVKCYTEKADTWNENLGRIRLESFIEVSVNVPTYVREGDFIIIQLTKTGNSGGNESGSKKLVSRIFGYLDNINVVNVDPKNNPSSAGSSQRSTTLLVMEVLVMKRPDLFCHLSNNAQITGVHRMYPHLMMCQAVSMLPKSPLCQTILTPSRPAMALLPPLTNESIIFNGPLDDLQTELVLKLVSSCMNRDHALMQVQGGPGTGKTHVIIAFILQLLYTKQWRIGTRPIILYCAHSNVAVDHATLQLKNYRQSLNKDSRYKLVRFGRVTSMKPEVRDVSTCSLGLRNDQIIMANKKKSLDEKIKVLVADLETPNTLSKSDLDEKSSKLHACVKEREMLKAYKPVYTAEKRPSYESESFVIENADVICTTFGSCGSKMLLNVFERIKAKDPKRKIICVVDEAMQSKESETVVPLQLGVTHLILFGDSRQLKSPVRCEMTQQYGLNQSLFWRILNIFNHGNSALSPVYTLKNQYRMNSAISALPSKFLYENCLKDVVKSKNTYNLHDYVVLIDNAPPDSTEKECETRLTLIAVKLISEVLNTMADDIPDNNFSVITSKNEHTKTLRATLSEKLDDKALPKLNVNPIENVQGQEFDIVLAIIDPDMVSCARGNVALTRAKHSLIILMSNPVYKHNKFLNKVAEDACIRRVSTHVSTYMEGQLLMKFVSKNATSH